MFCPFLAYRNMSGMLFEVRYAFLKENRENPRKNNHCSLSTKYIPEDLKGMNKCLPGVNLQFQEAHQ